MLTANDLLARRPALGVSARAKALPSSFDLDLYQIAALWMRGAVNPAGGGGEMHGR